MNKTKLFSLAVIAASLFVCSIVTAPKFPDHIPRQQIRDSIGASKFAYYQGAPDGR